MVTFPNAKINIGLNIVEKRKDNFHTIETIFYPIGLADILETVENSGKPDNIFKSTGIEIPGKKEENLCLRAYQMIKADYPVPPVKIHLHKIVPIGAGLGGGSSDAAFFIHQIDNIFSLGIPMKVKLSYAAKLGSDCSFFIKNQPSFAYGRGEKLRKISLSLRGYHLVLVCPEVHVSTREAYSGVKPQRPLHSLKEMIERPVKEWKSCIYNQFEDTIFKQFPVIEKIKTELYSMGAVYASMSGSGSSVYGLFSSSLPKKKLKSRFKKCFLWMERLR